MINTHKQLMTDLLCNQTVENEWTLQEIFYIELHLFQAENKEEQILDLDFTELLLFS